MRKVFYLLFAIGLLLLLMSVLSFVNEKKESESHIEVVLRNLGHKILLQAKDSTSRVLPIKKINESTYQVAFEKHLSFKPDTLMSLINQQLNKTNMPCDYIVSVNECNNNKTVFAYEINTSNGDIKPCGGRNQETGCYIIQVEFLAKKEFNNIWLAVTSILIMILASYLDLRRKKNLAKTEGLIIGWPKFADRKSNVTTLEYIEFGQFRLFDVRGVLNFNNTQIEVSEKEIKALKIFASNQNIIVERDRLRKELWENDGVIVIDRNVDVLVSKLRKKLSADQSIKIVNVHGKGYKLITENAVIQHI